jgi:hypothetical protein
MKRGDFIKQVEKGTYLYIQDKNKIIKVTRVFPDFQPAYAEYENSDGTLDAAFYTRVQVVPKETLIKLLNKKKNAE